MKDLKIIVSKQIQNQYKSTLDTITKKDILEQLEEFKDIEIPETLIEQEVHVITHGQEKEEIEKNKKINNENAKKRIKIGLILNEI